MPIPQSSDLVVTAAEHVTCVEIRRPPHNFLDNGLIHELADTFESLGKGQHCRAIVLCSQGKNFCAGGDYQPATQGNIGHDGKVFSVAAFFEQVARIFRCPLPVVAAVQGAAIGGGLGLAVSADFRVTCAAGRFSANFTRLGFNPGFGLVLTLPALIGKQRAALMCLTGRRITGPQAFAWGLADACVDNADVRSAAIALAHEVAGNAPLAIAATRASLRGDLVDRIVAQNVHDLAEQDRLRATEDWQEGIRASAERREPVFIGR
jgi:enoyl-CoA hydratase/carnithine racemase